MTPAKDNAAYDFSLFEPKQESEEKERVQEPKLVKTKAKITVSAGSVIRWVAVSLFIILSLIAIMLCNVQLNKLNDNISKQEQALSSAKADEVRLNVALESRSSLANVQSYAQNQGLRQASAYQITYVQLNDKDKVDVQPDKENIFTRLFNLILEYL